MQRLLSSKILSELRDTLPRLSSCSNSCKTYLRSFESNPNGNAYHLGSPISQFHHHHPVSLIVQRPSSFVLAQLNFYGRVLNPALVKHFVSSAHLKGSIKQTLLDYRAQFLKTQWQNKSFQIYPQYGRSWRSWSRRFTTDGVVLGLIIANVVVFLLWRVADHNFMSKNFTISVDNFRSGHVHTLVTSAFSHVDVGHLISNMIGLYFFGHKSGSVLGPEFLLKLYFSGAVVGSIFYLLQHAFLAQLVKNQNMWSRDPSRVPAMGASGAVSAIMLLNIFLFPKSTVYLQFFIPVPAILLGILLIGKDLLRIIEGDPQISGAAHLGGAAVAAVTWLQLRRRIRF
ncbi:hypothetical protein Ancab_036067 [Ancistrocladus abbreviatus]